MKSKTILNGPCSLLLFSVFFLQAFDASAQKVYRCDVNGKIEFRQVECKEGDESELYVTDPNGGMTPSEPGVRLPKKARKTRSVTRSKPSGSGGGSGGGANDQVCWHKQQGLARVQSKLRSGYRASEYKYLHDRQREYEDYISRFCR